MQPLQLLKRERPRSYALSNKEYVLVFRADKSNKVRSIAEFVPASDFDGSSYRSVRNLPVYGCLGLVHLQDHTFLGIVTGCAQVAKIREGEAVQRIHATEWYCLDSASFDDVNIDINGMRLEPGQEDIYESITKPAEYEHPCLEIRRLLEGGTFYFSADHDLSTNLQTRCKEDYDPEIVDSQFLWNGYMISSIMRMRSNMAPPRRQALDNGRFLTSIIRGFAETISTTIGNSTAAQLTLISRLSCMRAGTRFNARGIDDDGNVANFVESESILNTNTWTSSFCQTRGSVPLFWEQLGTGFLGHKVEVTRSPAATQSAFEKHFYELLEKYGGQVHVVNLLGTASGESMLTGLYRNAIQNADFANGSVRNTEFDFHNEVRSGYEGAASIKPLLRISSDVYGFFLTPSSPPVLQTGVFRTNCLDCLDRTNMIQNILSQTSVESMLLATGIHPPLSLWDHHGVLWADNGDALSRIYAGTGALKTSFTRKGKMSIAGALADATKSVSRMYINNFQDKGRQQTIDVMLGRLVNQKDVILYDPIAEWVQAQVKKRESEWGSRQTLKVFAGTYNLNGRQGNEELDLWLFPTGREAASADIYVIGFQEIVELTPSQIMSADPVKIRQWADKVLQCLNQYEEDAYLLLRHGQLVGAALLVFVRVGGLKLIKNVEGSIKKTGLKGMSGNKGAVAIRMDYGNTRICFVNAHFAAGHSNYEERNRDFWTILNGIRFQRGRGIVDHHDAIIWLGDFNYRIALPVDEVKKCIDEGNWGKLYEADQLNNQMVEGNIFQYFSESEILFPPTYKFDNGTDEYDTSEKQRIPAWTDRIMKKGAMIRQLSYNSAPLRFSDHKPVYATYELEIQIVDEPKKAAVEKELYGERRAAVDEGGADVGDIDLLSEGDLPPPSSDRSKWWLQGHGHAKSNLALPKDTMLNPNRAPNPFKESAEPEIVSTRKPLPPPPAVSRKPVALNAASLTKTDSMKSEAPPLLPTRKLSIPISSDAKSDAPPPLPTRKPSIPISEKPPLPSRVASIPVENPTKPLLPVRRIGAPASDQQAILKTEVKGETAAKISLASAINTKAIPSEHLIDEDEIKQQDKLSLYKSLA